MNYKYKQSAIALGVMAAFAMTDVAVASQKQLEEVVVTARKRAENLQDVPMAVSAFSSDQLKDYQVEGITDLERLASNVTLTETSGLISGQLQVFVRGIGNDPGLDQGVGIYVDDVYLNRTTGAVLDVYDVERIEILKGPQGHLYGRNTIGGAIKYVSREPREELEANIEVKVGEFDQRQIKANISGPLIDDKLYGSFGVLNKQRDGTQTNTYDGEQFNSRDVQAYRGTLLFNAADNLKIKLTGDYTKDESMPGVPNRVALNQDMLDGISFVITGNGYLPGFPVLMDEPNDQSLPTDIDRVSSEYTQGYKKFEIETKTAALNVEWDINDQWMLKSVTAGRWSDYVQPFDFDGSEQQFITSVKNREAVDLSQEFQLNYSGDTVSAVLGLYHLDGHLETDGQNLQYPRLRAIQYHIKDTSEETSDLESTSVYGNIDWDFAEDWQLSVGGRYTQDKKTFEKFASVTQGYFALARFNFLPPSAVVAVMPGQESVAAAYPGFIGWAGAPTFMEITGPENIQKVSDTWTEFSPSTRLSYHLSEDTLLYAGISTGFKAGGFESSGADAPSFDPETVTTYSIGFKTTLLDNRLRLNGEWFLNDYTDKQLSVITLVGAELESTTSNVGELTTQGAELELSWMPEIEGLMLGLNVGYLDAQIDSYESIDEDTGLPVDLADRTAIGFSPNWTAQARIGYELPLADLGTLLMGTDVSYRSKSFTNSPVDTTDPLLSAQVQEEHVIWNAMVSFQSADQHWRVSLEGRNLEDKRVLTNTYNVGPFVTGGYNLPRSWSLSVGYSY